MDEEKTRQRIYKINFATVYPMYITKVEKKGRTKKELDHVIAWLLGYTPSKLQAKLKKQPSVEVFVNDAPKLNPARQLVTRVICGMRVEDIKDPVVQTIRYLDKLVDELAKGRSMEKILRK
jgi:hypothetical protein